LRIAATALAVLLLPEWFGSDLPDALRVLVAGAALASLTLLPAPRSAKE
jgi:hypothetical protein